MKKNKFSVNLPAIFFGPVWFAYRKMYLFLIAFYGGIFSVGLLFDMLKINIPQSGFTVAVILIGMYSNHLYLDFVRRKIGKFQKDTNDENALREKVVKNGGVSIIGAVIAGIFMLINASLIFIDLFYQKQG